MASISAPNELPLSVPHASKLPDILINAGAGDASTFHFDRAPMENPPKEKKSKSKAKKEPEPIQMVDVEFGDEITVTNHDKSDWSKNGLWIPHTKGTPIAVKLWQVLPCRYHFFCNGNIMIGHGKPLWIYTFFGIIFLSASFVIFDVLPYYVTWPDLIVGSVFLFMAFISTYNLLSIVTSDPVSNHYALTGGKSAEEIASRYGYTSYCRICKISTTHTTIHCHECHACIDLLSTRPSFPYRLLVVAEKDHHCMLLGTCVAKRNYRSFFIFIVCLQIVVWIGLIVSITHLVQNWMAEGFSYAAVRALTLYLILSALVLPPGGLILIIILPFEQLYQMFPHQESVQGEGTDQTNHINLTLKEKLSIFWSNFNQKVIKKASSQIPPSKLQCVVHVPAIPRTKEVDDRLKSFHAWNFWHVQLSRIMGLHSDDPGYHSRMDDNARLLHTYKYAGYCVPVWDTEVARANETIAISIADEESVQRSAPQGKPKVEKPQRKSLFFRCFNQCVFTPPAFPAMKSSTTTDHVKPGDQTTIII
ncbi:putative palmitoyltransferase ZDHHC14, partial [Orchesella cincta]